MLTTYGFLLDYTTHNFMRKLALEIHRKYDSGFKAALLPPHISLKQSFWCEDLARAEDYFDELAVNIEPFPIAFTGISVNVYRQAGLDQGVIWLNVAETPTLRALHNKIIADLKDLFDKPCASFDGDAFRFHATIVLGGQPAVLYHRMYQSIEHISYQHTFTPKELVMFYLDDDSGQAGTYITYKRAPLK